MLVLVGVPTAGDVVYVSLCVSFAGSLAAALVSYLLKLPGYHLSEQTTTRRCFRLRKS